MRRYYIWVNLHIYYVEKSLFNRGPKRPDARPCLAPDARRPTCPKKVGLLNHTILGDPSTTINSRSELFFRCKSQRDCLLSNYSKIHSKPP